MRIDIRHVKTQLPKLIKSVMQGNEIIIIKEGKPVAKLIREKKLRRFGLLKGKIKITKNFDEPLPKNTLHDFNE